MSAKQVLLTPIGHVASPRSDLSDDNWGSVESVISIDSGEIDEEALLGLDSFSHLEVVYHFHRVEPEKIHTGARRPRGREDWPRVGILAQRAKARPNRIGVSRCQLLAVDGRKLTVRGLDAVDGTPVLDVKPYFVEFGPIGEVHQPAWSHEVMTEYYR